MHDIFSREPDPLDGLLTPLTPESNELRQQLYAQTRRVLRRRHLVRQLAYAATVAASFVLGFMVLRVLSPPSFPPQPQEVAQPNPRAPDKPPAPMTAEEPALAKEWKAFDSAEQSGELYQQAGDRYMTEEIDPQSALRCYTNALDNATKPDLTISTDDNWLLMAIKDARQKEKSYATNGS